MSLAKQLQDYRLTTAEILYRLPDHPEILQTYVWQDLDIAPRFPVLRKFLDFWKRELEGMLHSVVVSHCGLIKPRAARDKRRKCGPGHRGRRGRSCMPEGSPLASARQ